MMWLRVENILRHMLDLSTTLNVCTKPQRKIRAVISQKNETPACGGRTVAAHRPHGGCVLVCIALPADPGLPSVHLLMHDGHARQGGNRDQTFRRSVQRPAHRLTDPAPAASAGVDQEITRKDVTPGAEIRKKIILNAHCDCTVRACRCPKVTPAAPSITTRGGCRMKPKTSGVNAPIGGSASPARCGSGPDQWQRRAAALRPR
jgi:hypothetical protein